MKNVCLFLQELVGRSHALLSLSYNEIPPSGFDRDYSNWIESALQTLNHAELSDYWSKVSQQHINFPSKPYTIERITGLLQSAIECLERGFAGKLKYVLHAEMFGSLAEQARELLRLGHLVPAAMLGRVALENWLRDEAEKWAIPDHATEKASKLNDALKAQQKLSQPKWRLIQSLLDVGNAAAHGKIDQFGPGEVNQMLTWIESNCLG